MRPEAVGTDPTAALKISCPVPTTGALVIPSRSYTASDAELLKDCAGVKAGTPPDVIAYLNKHIEEALADPKIQQRIADLGGAPMGGTPEDFGKIIASETAKWKKVVEYSGASVE